MDFFLDQPLYFGTPWHGRLNGTTLTLPNATTRTQPGDAVDGGDFFAVKKPGQPAVTTTADEAAQGKQWLNYGIISGKNHVFYGKALGARSWLYIDGDGDVWLVSVDFPSATATITFKRFGQLGEPPAAVAQTISITPGWSTVKALHLIQDITPTGNKVVWSHRDPLESSHQGARSAPNLLQGVTLLTITGKPPAASVTWAVARTETECRGTLVDNRITSIHWWYAVKKTDNTGSILRLETDIVVPTYNSPVSGNPVPPAGYDFINDFGLIANTSLSDQVSRAVRSGKISYTGGTIGAIFDASGDVQFVTFDAEHNQSVVPSAYSGVYSDGIFSPYQSPAIVTSTTHHWGGVSLRVGGSAVSSIDFDVAMVTDNTGIPAGWSLEVSVGGMLEYSLADVGPTGLWVYDDFDIEASDTRVMVQIPAPMAKLFNNTSARIFPARFSNLCYGIIVVAGKNQHVDPVWSEDAVGSAVERAEVVLITSGLHAVSGEVTTTDALQHIFAAGNRETGALAVSSTDNVAYI